MEYFATILIPLLLGVILVRMVLMPIGLAWKLGLHTGCGFLCLWLLNTLAPFTGIAFPINTVTAAIAGFLGVPGIGVVAMLEMLA